MMLIDMTSQVAPVLFAMSVLAVLGLAGIFASAGLSRSLKDFAERHHWHRHLPNHV